MSNKPPPGIKDPYGPGLTWDEASPELRRIVAKNQEWAEAKGYAPKNSPEHGALRMMRGEQGIDEKDQRGKR